MQQNSENSQVNEVNEIKNDNNSKIQVQRKRARRTRKDQNGRDYKCSCGKSYLSYPALYTHIKTKHEGKVEISLQQVPQKMTEEEDKTVTKQDLEQLKIYLSKFYPQRIRGVTIEQLSEQLTQEQKQYILPQLEYWNDIQKGIKPQFQQNLLSARHVFGKLIFDMNRRTNPNCIKFLLKLIMLIQKGICSEKKDIKYFDQCTASQIPNLYNELIINNHIPISKTAPEKIFQQSEPICVIMVHICNWMFNQKYTNYTVKYRL